jgi:uncharacterized protein YndB with AHSA1/START domain
MSTDGAAARAAESELVITRFFNAPPDIVFAAFTQPKHLKRWWGPRNFTTPEFTVDLRPGGKLHFCMRSPTGQDFWCVGTYRDIEPPARLVYTNGLSDEHGNVLDPAAYGFPPEWPREVVVTTEFSEEVGRTKLTLHLGVSEPLAERVMARQGWTESLDRLGEYLGGMKGEQHGQR